MFRKDLIELLLNNPQTVREIARSVREKPGDVEDDLRHLLKSLKRSSLQVLIEPARCQKCGFEFGEEKLRKPSRCPECRSQWLTEPRIGFVK